MFTPKKQRILVIDDDLSILELVRVNLEIHGYDVIIAEDAVKGLALNKQESPDLIILDLMMPKLDGFTACQQIRADQKGNSSVPVLMLSAMSSVDDKITGFDVGTDDYLTKPFEIGELLVRVKALLRRAKTNAAVNGGKAAVVSPEILHCGEITLLPETREAEIAGKMVRFTPIEFEILYCLMQSLGRPISPTQLLKDVWGYSPSDDIETIRVHIRHLRQRLEDAPEGEAERVGTRENRTKKFVRTIYGKGYQLIPEGFFDD